MKSQLRLSPQHTTGFPQEAPQKPGEKIQNIKVKYKKMQEGKYSTVACGVTVKRLWWAGWWESEVCNKTWNLVLTYNNNKSEGVIRNNIMQENPDFLYGISL